MIARRRSPQQDELWQDLPIGPAVAELLPGGAPYRFDLKKNPKSAEAKHVDVA